MKTTKKCFIKTPYFLIVKHIFWFFVSEKQKIILQKNC